MSQPLLSIETALVGGISEAEAPNTIIVPELKRASSSR